MVGYQKTSRFFLMVYKPMRIIRFLFFTTRSHETMVAAMSSSVTNWIQGPVDT